MQVKKIKKAKTDAVAGGVTAEMEVIATDGYGGASSEEVLRKSKRLLLLPVCHFFYFWDVKADHLTRQAWDKRVRT